MTDYCFVHPNPKFKENLNGFRWKTYFIKKKSISSVQGFINHLKNKNITAETLLISAHGDTDIRKGIFIELAMKNGQNGMTYYETISQLHSDDIKIPDKLREKDKNNTPKKVNVIFRSCIIGEVPPGKKTSPFLKKLKPAFGKNAGKVSAPKFTLIVTNSKLSRVCRFEYMEYEFSIFSKVKLTRTALLNQFLAQHNDINGQPFKRKFFESIIPTNNIHGNHKRKSFSLKLGKRIEGIEAIPSYKEYAYWHEGRQMIISVPPKFQPHIKNEKQRLDRYAKKKFILPKEYPKYVRAGYKSVNDFLKGYNWEYNRDKHNKVLKCIGHRHVYKVTVPILKPDTNKSNPDDWILIFNYYPIAAPSINSYELNMEGQQYHQLLYSTV